MKIDPSAPSILIVSNFITLILLAVISLLTKSSAKRIVAALIASVPMFFIVILVDYYSKKIGLWNYPSISGSIGPLAWYSATAIGYGAGFGLLGYWMKIKYGKKGLYIFLILFGLFGFLRDFSYSRFSNMIAFNKGYISYISDIISYIFGASIVQIVMAMILERRNSNK